MSPAARLAALAALALTAAGTPAPSRAQTASTINIQHDEGVTAVPMNPKRVVVISEELLDFAFALKMNVVGLGSPRITPADLTSDKKINIRNAGSTFFRFGNLENVTYVGGWAEPSLETILALKPDLILRLHWSGIQGYDKLSAIAPTLSFGQNRPDGWQSILTELAKIGNKQSLARSFISDYNLKLARARSDLAKAGILRRYPKFMVVSPFGSGQVYLYSGNRIANVMRGLGFSMTYPEGLSRTDEEDRFGWQTLSPEVLLKVPADTLVVNAPFLGSASDTAKLEGSIALLRKSRGRIVDYAYPAYSPWMGPNTDKQMVQDLTRAILASKP